MNNFNTDCKTYFVHKNILKKVISVIPRDEILYDLADFYKMFADTTRIKILQALLVSEMCVCDIAELLSVSQSAISHQLKTLRQTKLIKFRREGKVVFYSLKDDHVKKILDLGLQHINELI